MRGQRKSYQNSINKFLQIPKGERTNYITKILATEQIKEPPPAIFAKQFTSRDTFLYQQHKLNYHFLENHNNPTAIIVHFHGLNSHGGLSGYYATQILSICPQANFYSLDQMNFGQSEGPCRGLISALDDSATQGQFFVDFLLKKFNNKTKVFLSGSSFGGTIIFKMSLRNPEKYSGLILLVPALRDLSQSKPCMKRLAKCLGYIMPRVHIPVGQTFDNGTKYDCSQYQKKDEHAVRGQVVPGTISQVLYGMESVSNQYANMRSPYILIQGGVQKMVDPFAPLDLLELSPSKDKTTLYYENLWHAVFYEEEIEDIAYKIGEWVKKRAS